MRKEPWRLPIVILAFAYALTGLMVEVQLYKLTTRVEALESKITRLQK